MINVGIQRNVKYKAFLEQFQRGENSQNRDLRTWLGAVGYDSANRIILRSTFVSGG